MREKTSDCAFIQENLQAYQDGTLERTTHTKILRHLRGCEKCSDKLSKIRVESLAKNENLWAPITPEEQKAAAPFIVQLIKALVEDLKAEQAPCDQDDEHVQYCRARFKVIKYTLTILRLSTEFIDKILHPSFGFKPTEENIGLYKETLYKLSNYLEETSNQEITEAFNSDFSEKILIKVAKSLKEELVPKLQEQIKQLTEITKS